MQQEQSESQDEKKGREAADLLVLQRTRSFAKRKRESSVYIILLCDGRDQMLARGRSEREREH